MTLLVNKNTIAQIDSLIQSPPHAVIISGPAGLGKNYTTKYIADKFFPQKSEYYQSVRIYNVSDDDFGVGTISSIQKFIKTKNSTNSIINKLVIIHSGQDLSVPAQNKLLKTLEEPNTGVLIIICVTNKNYLLPTITSRCQNIILIPPNFEQLEEHFIKKQYSIAEIKKAYNISNGLPQLMQSLLENNEHELRTATDVAKQILSSNHFDRLSLSDELSKDKNLLINVAYMLQKIAISAIQNKDSSNALKWLKVLKSSYEAEDALSKNVSTKLVCNRLMLSV